MAQDKLSQFDFYPLIDYHYAKIDYPTKIKAQWTGEKRPPKKGEWYLSGAIIEAHQAKHDMSSSYHIAKIVLIQTITFGVVTDVLPNERIV